MGHKGPPRDEGPDWTDLTDYWRAMKAHHGAELKVVMSTLFPESPGNPTVLLRVIATPGAIPSLYTGAVGTTEVSGEFPRSDARLLSSYLYRLTSALDEKLAREWWSQRELPV